MARREHSALPVIDVVGEIAMEGNAGDYALARAEELLDKVRDGASLDGRSAGSLVRLLAGAGDDFRFNVVNALAFQAIRADDATIVEAVAGAGKDALETFLAADVRMPIGGRVMAAILAAIEAADDLEAVLARRLETAIFSATDIVPAKGRLLALVAKGDAATAAILAAMTQDTAYRRRQQPGVDRKPLERAADAAFRPALERIAAGTDAASHVAHRILVGVAAAKGRWRDVDAATATVGPRSGARAYACARGLLDAAHDATFHLGTTIGEPASDDPDFARVRGLVREVVSRVERLRPSLRKADLAATDDSLAYSARTVDLPLASHADLSGLVDALFAAGPRKIHAIESKLVTALRANPSAYAQLPPLAKAKKGAPARVLARLHLRAIRAAGDAKALRAHLAARRRLDASVTEAISSLANGRESREPFAAVIGPYLEDPDAAHRWWAAYFFRKLAKEPADVSAWAEPLLRLVTDSARPPGMRDTVASEARRAVEAAVEATSKRDRFRAIARKLLASADPKTEKILRALVAR
jgi:hypothetical protein